MLDECVIINVSKVFCVTCDGRTENWETKILVCSVCGWLRHCSVSADGLSMLSVDGLIKTVWQVSVWVPDFGFQHHLNYTATFLVMLSSFLHLDTTLTDTRLSP